VIFTLEHFILHENGMISHAIVSAWTVLRQNAAPAGCRRRAHLFVGPSPSTPIDDGVTG
jgi:hypothetical protein